MGKPENRYRPTTEEMRMLHEKAAQAPIDPVTFRKVMGNFATGVAVVTTAVDGTRFGMAVNSLASVSLDPCLLLVCPKKGSATGDAIKRSGVFAVNVLGESQQDLCMRFVGEEASRFDELDLDEDNRGVPLLPGSLAHISCQLEAVHPGGDHDIIVGRVVDCSLETGNPLIFHDGQFCRRAA
ncbi:flavin reductase family protein [Hoeflea sp. YIM 152468]|uniref:flavin reductase family protein n=1 Tax=Hoeflea sp. YIM 152468 TaxID=3031759 RepID=UPI0023DC036E|nr:flavin reductase family protein [Hoeflea sp. YIM 152468]MDF1610245.1 flavin reductase family protein [Hoeflea sp. YIM 152468]